MDNAYQTPAADVTIPADNNSGQGKVDHYPAGVTGWSTGAFLLNWIWAIGNRSWIGLLALVPYIGFIMAIVLGFKGREWAWQNKRWESVEHFNRVQRLWTIWGVAIFVISIVAGALFMVLASGES